MRVGKAELLNSRNILIGTTGAAAFIGAMREVVIFFGEGATTQTDWLYAGLTWPMILMSLASVAVTGPTYARLKASSELSDTDIDQMFFSFARTSARYGIIVTSTIVVAATLATFRDFRVSGSSILTHAALASLGIPASVGGSFYTAIAHRRERFWQAQLGEVGQNFAGFLSAIAAVAFGQILLISLGLTIGTVFNYQISRAAAGAPSHGPGLAPKGQTTKLVRAWWSVSGLSLLGHPAALVERAVLLGLPAGTLSSAQYGRRWSSVVSTVVGGSLASIAVARTGSSKKNNQRRARRAAITGSALTSIPTIGFAGMAIALRTRGILEIRSELLAFAMLAPFVTFFTVAGRFALTRVDTGRRALLVFVIVGPLLASAILLLNALPSPLTLSNERLALSIAGANAAALAAAAAVSLRK